MNTACCNDAFHAACIARRTICPWLSCLIPRVVLVSICTRPVNNAAIPIYIPEPMTLLYLHSGRRFSGLQTPVGFTLARNSSAMRSSIIRQPIASRRRLLCALAFKHVGRPRQKLFQRSIFALLVCLSISIALHNVNPALPAKLPFSFDRNVVFDIKRRGFNHQNVRPSDSTACAENTRLNTPHKHHA